MTRSDLLLSSAALGVAGHTTFAPLSAPAGGVPVAFLLSDGAVMIDWSGPWEVFQDVRVPSRTAPTFNLYTVAETKDVVQGSGGVKIAPDYTLANAPAPKVVVIPAQADPTPAVIAWLQHVSKTTDVIMSVCTGAFVLAQTGLLDGRSATTHHGAFSTFAMRFPKITLKRGARFVDEGPVATSAGLSAGIDLALHVAARYYGHETARQTTYYMEYLSDGWRDPHSNSAYARPPAARAGEALCPVCWMNVDPKVSPSSEYGGKVYSFCMPPHKELFDAAPSRYLGLA